MNCGHGWMDMRVVMVMFARLLACKHAHQERQGNTHEHFTQPSLVRDMLGAAEGRKGGGGEGTREGKGGSGSCDGIWAQQVMVVGHGSDSVLGRLDTLCVRERGKCGK